MILRLLTFAIISTLVGCTASSGGANVHMLGTATPRIISLAPSLTEIAYAVGCGDMLIADTAYDDYPAPAKALPHVADLVHADLERIAQLKPTLVLALHDQEREASTIHARLGVPIVFLPNRALDDLYADIAGVAAACNRVSEGTALSASLRAQIDKIAVRAQRKKLRPSVLYLLGLPGFTVGKRSYLNDLITLAGGTNVAGSIDDAYPNLSAEAILRADPDVIIVSGDTPFGADVRAREPWRSLRAVHTGHVVRPPNDSILERRGPRLVAGLEWLSAVFR